MLDLGNRHQMQAVVVAQLDVGDQGLGLDFGEHVPGLEEAGHRQRREAGADQRFGAFASRGILHAHHQHRHSHRQRTSAPMELGTPSQYQVSRQLRIRRFAPDFALFRLRARLQCVNISVKRRAWCVVGLTLASGRQDGCTGCPAGSGCQPCVPALFHYCTALLVTGDAVHRHGVPEPAPEAGAAARRRPTSPRRRRTRRRCRRAWPSRCCSPAPARPSRPRPTWSPCTTPGWTTDGKMFDSSVRAERAQFVPARPRHQGLGRGRAADGRRRDSAGSGFRETLAYNGTGRPARRHAGVRRRAARVHRRRRRSPPPDVAAPPDDAKSTASGLAYKVLKAGTGTDHPTTRQPGHRALLRLADQRQDVRQLGDARAAGHASASATSSRAGPKACS